MVAFNQIPLVINTPGTFLEFVPNPSNQLAFQPHVTLLVGQKLTGGSAPADKPCQPASKAEALTMFGQHSQMLQIYNAYRERDALTEVWCIPQADGDGTAAVGDIAVTGTATEGGEQVIWISGRRVSVAVTNTMTAAAFMTAGIAAINALKDCPVLASQGTGKITLTARHEGTIGNFIKVGMSLAPGERDITGLAFTVTQPTTGATDPSYTTVVSAMSEDQYNTIVLGLQTKTEQDKIVTEMEDRWGPMRAIEGQVFVAKPDTKANLQTAGATYNSHTLSLVGYEVSALSSAPWEVAARAAAVDARQTQTDPSRARTGMLIGGYSAPRGSRFSRAEQDNLLGKGVSTVLAASDGRMAIQRLITTYQTNASGVADTSMRDIFTVRTLAAIRFSLRQRIAVKFDRYKLADDGAVTPPGSFITTPKLVKAEVLAWYAQLCNEVGWAEGYDTFAEQIRVERDSGDKNRLNAYLPTNLIDNLLVFAGQIAFE